MRPRHSVQGCMYRAGTGRQDICGLDLIGQNSISILGLSPGSFERFLFSMACLSPSDHHSFTNAVIAFGRGPRLITGAGCLTSYNLLGANHKKPAENKMQAIKITPIRTITMPSQSSSFLMGRSPAAQNSYPFETFPSLLGRSVKSDCYCATRPSREAVVVAHKRRCCA